MSQDNVMTPETNALLRTVLKFTHRIREGQTIGGTSTITSGILIDICIAGMEYGSRYISNEEYPLLAKNLKAAKEVFKLDLGLVWMVDVGTIERVERVWPLMTFGEVMDELLKGLPSVEVSDQDIARIEQIRDEYLQKPVYKDHLRSRSAIMAG